MKVILILIFIILVHCLCNNKELYTSYRDFIKEYSFKQIRNETVLDWVLMNINIEHNLNDLWMEFGVYSGETINLISNYTKGTVYGFDSFEGLPETWRPGFIKGTFNMDYKLPKVNNNVILIKGWFNDTLIPFINKHKDKSVTFLHLDADLYSSTIYVLNVLKTKIKPKCVIVFDELFDYDGYDGDNGELRALYEFVNKNNITFKALVQNGERAAIQIIDNPLYSPLENN